MEKRHTYLALDVQLLMTKEMVFYCRWGLVNLPDPGNMLAWFADELDKAERNNEKVHVLAHIPTISLMQPFKENWHRLLNR